MCKAFYHSSLKEKRQSMKRKNLKRPQYQMTQLKLKKVIHMCYSLASSVLEVRKFRSNLEC